MSPRAACRLEALGFAEVYDYTGGKTDWLARGLPREGENAGLERGFELKADDVVTCELSDPVGRVRERVAASRYGFAFVVSPGRVLLGRLRRAALEGDPEARAEDVMEPGPSTIRADSQLEPLAERMRSQDLTSLPVTDPEGRLLGVVRRDDLEAALARGAR
ncbi:MAG: CBS domain-containing protein [Thermoleophilaceae bacterium]